MTPDLTVFHSLDRLIEAGRQHADQAKVVSFDLFDTLLIRRIHDPDLVKLPVARYIASLAMQQGKNWSWQRVQKLRDSVEKKQRKETGKRFDDLEACYPVFMETTLREIFQDSMSSELLEKVTDYEMAMESSMLVPREQFVEWLAELQELGKRIFIVSDIYLPSLHLRRLVERAGLLQYAEEVVSSADSFLAKASGKAYPLMRERFDLSREGWFHVGDNPISDGVRPVEFGIKALVLHDASEKWRKSIIKRQYNYSDGRPFWRGRALQQLMMPLEAENVKRSALYAEGYNFLSPLIGAFVQRIAERARELGVKKVYFLSREGWTFERVWNEIAPLLFPEGNLPETHYLYVSRMALAGASCAHQGLTRDNADIVFLPAGNRDFRDVCRIFGLQLEPLVAHLESHQLLPETTLSGQHEGYEPDNRLRFNELLEDEAFQDEVRSQVQGSSEALQRYLSTVGFFEHDDVALVDIGWLGTIQRFFYQAIAHREDKPRCHGFLFSATRGIPYPTTPDNYIEGFIYDRHRFDLGGSAVLYARDLFEEACRAPHPTLNGYLLKEDGFELDFRTTEDETGKAEMEQDAHFSDLQQAIFDGAKRYAAASALLGSTLQDYKPWFNYLLISKLAFAKTREICNIRHKHHLDDFHGAKTPSRKASKAQRNLWDSTLRALRFSPLLRTRLYFRHIKDRLNE